MLLAILGAELDHIAAAGTHVGLGAPDRTGVGPEPLGYLRGVRPGGIDFFRRGIETTFEREARLDGGVGLGGLDGHVSSSTKAARRSSCWLQKRAYRFSQI